MKKILIIEDEAKHIADAKAVLANNADVAADFATTFVEAEKLMKENKYDGIISDIFFPYNDKSISASFPLGWYQVIKIRCYNLLENFGMNYGNKVSSFTEKMVNAADEWMEGRSMHPTGVVIADMALKDKTPVVLCTDTYHHGYKTQPVCSWASKNSVEMVDAYPKTDEYTAHAGEKNWEAAIMMLFVEMEYGLKGYAATKKADELRKEK